MDGACGRSGDLGSRSSTAQRYNVLLARISLFTARGKPVRGQRGARSPWSPPLRGTVALQASEARFGTACGMQLCSDVSANISTLKADASMDVSIFVECIGEAEDEELAGSIGVSPEKAFQGRKRIEDGLQGALASFPSALGRSKSDLPSGPRAGTGAWQRVQEPTTALLPGASSRAVGQDYALEVGEGHFLDCLLAHSSIFRALRCQLLLFQCSLDC